MKNTTSVIVMGFWWSVALTRKEWTGVSIRVKVAHPEMQCWALISFRLVNDPGDCLVHGAVLWWLVGLYGCREADTGRVEYMMGHRARASCK